MLPNLISSVPLENICSRRHLVAVCASICTKGLKEWVFCLQDVVLLLQTIKRQLRRRATEDAGAV